MYLWQTSIFDRVPENSKKSKESYNTMLTTNGTLNFLAILDVPTDCDILLFI